MYRKEIFRDLDELMEFANQSEDYDYRPINRKIIDIITEQVNDKNADKIYTLIYVEEYL